MLEARIMNKNAEQTSNMRRHPGSFWSDFFLDISTTSDINRGSAFLMMHYGKVQGTQTKRNI